MRFLVVALKVSSMGVRTSSIVLLQMCTRLRGPWPLTDSDWTGDNFLGTCSHGNRLLKVP